MNVQEWLRNLEAAPKTKGHIKAVIHRLYEKAMLWEMVEWQRNPMEFVEIKGISKRRKRPVILTVEQFFLILPLIPQPYRMMALLAQCSGLRVEEVLALEKPDIHFGKLSMQIVRAVVHGRLKLVKTEYSEDELPLDPDLAAILLDFIREAEREALAKLGDQGAGIIESDLLFVSPMTGRHFHASPIGQDYIRPAGCCLVDCPNCGAVAGEWCKTDFPVPNGKRLPLHDERWDAAGKYGSIGWHTFRHTYRSWLDETGAPMGVQQKLMRHAQISTTMNVYGNALMEAKREANAAVVNRILRSA
jgi:integrase